MLKKHLIMIFLGLMLVLTLTGCGENQVMPQKDLGQAPPEAIKLVRDKMGDPKLPLEYFGTDKDGINLGTPDEKMDFKVSKDFTKLNFASLKDINYDLGKQNLTPKEARDLAAVFAGKLYPEIAKLTPGKNEDDFTSEGIGYFTWQLVENGVRLPSGIRVEVEPKAGKILKLELRDFPLHLNLTPTISKEKAQEIAKAEVMSPEAKPEISDIMLFAGSFGGSDRLIWSMAMAVYQPQKQGKHLIYSHDVYLDAHTGEIIRSDSEKVDIVKPSELVNNHLKYLKERDWRGAYFETMNIAPKAKGLKSFADYQKDEEASGWNSNNSNGYKLESFVILNENINDDGTHAKVGVSLTVTKKGKTETIKEEWPISKVKGEWRLDWMRKG